MNSRQAKLLVRLLSEEEIEIADWIAANGISERTLRNDIALLQRQTGSIGNIFLKGGRIKAHLEPEYRAELEKLIADSDFYWYKLSRDERVLIACLTLLLQDGYATTDQIAESLCVSRNTVVGEADALRKWFSGHGLRLETRNRYGFCVKGSEEAVRRAIADIALEGVTHNSIFSLMLRRMLYLTEDYLVVKKAVVTYERAYGLSLSDTAFQKTVLDILIILNRVNSGKYVSNHGPSPDARLQKFASGLLAALNGRFSPGPGIHMSREARFLAQRLKNRISLGAVHDEGLSHPAELLAFSFACGVSIDCNLEDQVSQENLRYLSANIADMLKRSKNGEMVAEGLYHRGVEEDYPAVCAVVKKHLAVLRKYMGRQVSQDEFAYLVMCLVSTIEGLTMRPVKTLLVCSSGKDTAVLLKTKLERHFKITILNTVSMHSLETAFPNEAELIISTGPLGPRCWPVLTLEGCLLKDQDILKIHEQIERVYKKRFLETVKEHFCGRVPAEPALSSLLCAQRVRLDILAEDWTAAVRAAGALLVEQDKAEPRYVDKILENVSEFGPYIVFVSGVAIAHAGYEDGGKSLAASVVRLQTPVAFGHEANDPVKYVFCVSTTRQERHQEAMFRLMRLLSDPEIRRQMDAAASSEEFLKLFA